MTTGRAMAPEENCESCGARDWEIIRPTFMEGVLSWLSGGGAWRPERARCRSCGDIGPSPGVMLVEIRTSGWRFALGAPRRIWWMLRMRRSLIPAPWIYLASAGVGVLVGLALDRSLGWPWWAPALAFPVVAWLAFLATAFTPRARRMHRQGSMAEILAMIDPERGHARRMREQEEAIRNAPFPLFALGPSWSGSRRIEGMGWSSSSGPRFTLGHEGGLDPETPSVSVTAGAEGRLRANWDEERGEFVSGEVRQIRVPVDGAAVPFESVSEGEAWLAFGSVAGVGVLIRGHNFEMRAVELVTVTDVEPYIQGTRMWEEEMRRHSEER
jgi:hypothetical protein